MQGQCLTFIWCIYILISAYSFKSNQSLTTVFDSRHLPRTLLVLLESLLNIKPLARPSCERVLLAIKEGKVRTACPPLVVLLLIMGCASLTRFRKDPLLRTL